MIKLIKRKAYGFHGLRYFTLKIYQVQLTAIPQCY